MLLRLRTMGFSESEIPTQTIHKIHLDIFQRNWKSKLNEWCMKRFRIMDLGQDDDDHENKLQLSTPFV